MDQDNDGKDDSSFTERITVAGSELLDTIKRLIKAGNVRKVILWNESGKKLLEIPLTAGVAIGSAALILAPFMAAIAAIVGVAAKVRVEVIKDEDRACPDAPAARAGVALTARREHRAGRRPAISPS